MFVVQKVRVQQQGVLAEEEVQRLEEQAQGQQQVAVPRRPASRVRGHERCLHLAVEPEQARTPQVLALGPPQVSLPRRVVVVGRQQQVGEEEREIRLGASGGGRERDGATPLQRLQAGRSPRPQAWSAVRPPATLRGATGSVSAERWDSGGAVHVRSTSAETDLCGMTPSSSSGHVRPRNVGAPPF